MKQADDEAAANIKKEADIKQDRGVGNNQGRAVSRSFSNSSNYRWKVSQQGRTLIN